ncbi:MAG: NAD(+)/NADH kinase [Desulfonatronovibrionaceae bacterium]
MNGRGFWDSMPLMSSYFAEIALVTKEGNKKAAALGGEISQWLQWRGCRVVCVDNQVRGKTLDLGENSPDLILILGGDGTMLSVARKIGFNSVPFLGVNLGQVGFLADIDPGQWQKQLSRVLAGEYFLSPRLVLDFEVRRGQKIVYQGQGINDLVINRSGMARLNRFDLRVDSSPDLQMRADGIIVSTPTGSTAYNISAGGPLVYPEVDAFILTPVCPFLQKFAPMVVPGQSRIRIIVSDTNPSMYLTVDGQAGYEIRAGDELEIGRADKKMTILSTAGPEYFVARLLERGFLSNGEDFLE